TGAGDAIHRNPTEPDATLAGAPRGHSAPDGSPFDAAAAQEPSTSAARQAGLDLWLSTVRSAAMKMGIERWFWMAPLGRVLLALLFVQAGWSKAMQPQATAEFMASVG